VLLDFAPQHTMLFFPQNSPYLLPPILRALEGQKGNQQSHITYNLFRISPTVWTFTPHWCNACAPPHSLQANNPTSPFTMSSQACGTSQQKWVPVWDLFQSVLWQLNTRNIVPSLSSSKILPGISGTRSCICIRRTMHRSQNEWNPNFIGFHWNATTISLLTSCPQYRRQRLYGTADQLDSILDPSSRTVFVFVREYTFVGFWNNNKARQNTHSTTSVHIRFDKVSPHLPATDGESSANN